MSSFIVADRVQETCNAPGLGVVTLLGAVSQFQTFSAAIGNTNTTPYAIADVVGVNWEVGIGTYSSSGNTLTRTTVLASSNGGAAVNFSSGIQNVWVDYPAEYAVYASNNSSQILGQALISSGVGVAPTWGNINSTVGSPGYYGSFYDTTNQAAASTTVAYVVNIGSTFQSNQVSINSGNQITFLYAGVYNLQYSIQFINTNTGSSNNDNVDVWLRKNGTDVADSNSVYNIPSRKGSTDGANLAVVNYVLSVNAGDYLQLAWAVTNTTISIATLAAASSPTVPRTPGVIVTATPVTQIGIGYYGLTSATSTLIATGSKTFTTNLSATSTAFTVGTRVRVAYSTTPANYMEGVITAFTGTTLTVLVDSLGGSGTFASWTISVAGIQGSNGVTSFSGNSTGLTPSTATTGAISLGGTLNVANGGTGVTTSTGTGSVVLSATPTFTGTLNAANISYTGTLTGSTGILNIGSGQLYKDASGNVGIGTSSPTSKLSFGPNIGLDFAIFENLGGLNKYGIGMSGAGTAPDPYRTKLYANGSEYLSITASGNVGIGTSSPVTKLNISTSTAQNDAIGFIQIENTTSANGVNASYTAKNWSGTSQFMQWENYGCRIGSRIKTNFGAGGVYFTYGADAVGMTLDGSGNVGIGTTAPNNKLTVGTPNGIVGNGTVASFSGANVIASNTSGMVVITSTDSIAANIGGSIGFAATGTLAGYPTGSIAGRRENATAGDYSSYMQFTTSSSGGSVQEKMRIASSGIVTMSAYGAGAATFSAAGVISSVSDETWKIKDGIPVNPDEMIQKLKPGYWFYNAEKAPIFGTDRQLGFYAQNVNEAIGIEAAPVPEEGKPWGYYDRSVLAVTVLSLQKALATIEELTARLTKAGI